MNRFIDSMQHYGSGNINKKYNFPGSHFAVYAGVSPRGTAALGATSDGTGGYLGEFAGRTFDDQDTWIVGVRVNVPSIGCSPNLLKFFDHNLTEQVHVRLAPDGRICALRGPSGFLASPTLLGIAAGKPFFSGVWTYIEVKVVIHPSAGIFQVRVDNTLVIDLSGINTRSSALSSASVIALGGGNCGTTYFCDLYVNDGQGGSDTGFWGDTEIDYLSPDAAGSSSDWAPIGSGTNYENVDEVPPSLVDYNQATTPGERDIYNFPTITGSPIIKCIQGVALMAKDDGNDRRVQLTTKSNSIDYDGTVQDVPSSPSYLLEQWGDDPDTGADWLVANANSAEFGVVVEN